MICPLESELGGWSKWEFCKWLIYNYESYFQIFFDEYMFNEPCKLKKASKKWKERQFIIQEFLKSKNK